MSIKNYSIYSTDCGMLSMNDIINQDFTKQSNKAVLTDYNTLMGVPEFFEACNKQKVIPIIGVTLTVKDDSERLGNLTLYAKNKQGFDQLKKIVSDVVEDDFKEKSVQLDSIVNNSTNLIALTGGFDTILYNAIKNKDKDAAQKHLYILKKCFNEDMFFEIQVTEDPHCHNINSSIINIAKKNNISVFATNNNKMRLKGHYPLLHEKIKTRRGKNNKKNNEIELLNLKSEHIKTTEEMKHNFSSYMGDISNVSSLFSNIKPFNIFVDIPEIPSFPSIDDDDYFYKIVNEKYKTFRNKIPENKIPTYDKRLKEEMEIIKELNFEKYFILFEQIEKNKVDLQRFNLRGSSVSFLITYLLGLTDVDPVENGLLAERFLNRNRLIRHELPDIDLESNDLDSIFKHLVEVFGEKNTAYLSKSSSPKAKGQIELARRALEEDFKKNPLDEKGNQRYFPENEFNLLIKYITNMYGHKEQRFNEIFENGYISKRNAAQNFGIKGDWNSREFKNEYYKISNLKNVCKNNEGVKKIIGYINNLNGILLNSDASYASVVVSNSPINSFFSTQKIDKVNETSTKDIKIAIEAGKKYVEKIGLIKLDVLSNVYLDKLSKSYDQLKLNWDEENLENAYSYQNVYKMIGAGLTETLNQIKSEKQRELAKEVKVSNFKELVSFLALIRPAVGKENVDTYIKNKFSNEKVQYEHPIMEEILKETHGVLIFEEQIMEIAQKIGGFSKEESDDFRSIMKKAGSSKIKNSNDQKLEEMKQDLFKRATEQNNINPEVVNIVLERLNKVKGYAFSKAHSLSYAALVYRQALIDVKYPAEYIQNFLLDNNQKVLNKEEFNGYIKKCTKMNRGFLSIDINRSVNNFVTKRTNNQVFIDPSIHYVVKNKEFSELILEERAANGSYKNIYDFIERTLPKFAGESVFSGAWIEKPASSNLHYKKYILDLIKSGAFDNLAPNELKEQGKSQVRTCLVSSVDKAMELATNPFSNDDFVYNLSNQALDEKTITNDEDIIYGYSPSKLKKEAVEKKQKNLSKNNEQDDTSFINKNNNAINNLVAIKDKRKIKP